MKSLRWLAIVLALATPAQAQLGVPIGPAGGSGGSGGGSGTVTSIATGCQATGGTITTTGTISTQTVITALAGSNPAITTGYCGGLENFNNGSNQIPTIAVAGSAGFPQSWYTDLCNINAGTQTITPATGTIGGASTYVLAAGTAANPTCIRIISDAANTNYVVSGTGPRVGANPSATATGSAINGSAMTFMRSDAAPAINSATNAQLGLAEGDGTTISCSAGVCSVKAVPLASGSSTGNTLTGPYGYFVCTAACTVTPPVPVAGYQFCVMNADNTTGAITLGALGSSARYENTARTAYGTAGTGTLSSGGAAGDMICIIGLDSTHYLSPTYVGIWTAS
jgi:hypothetical protein